MRIGHGFDLHRLVDGRKLILGGIEIGHPKGLLGHSDADCLIHALADSILGALALPDIGHFFPDSERENKDMNSKKILMKAHKECLNAGYTIANTDLTIIAEEPKMAPHINKMKECIAPMLGISNLQIGIKATTNEGLGYIGREEAISCYAVTLLEKNS
tara:strand:+ start:1284 stop:1760 length:477 start_codon:yes stop_codon:yes gene_type:complete